MDRPEDRLALIELLDRDGRARRTLDVHAWPVTLGRALDNTWVLDDPHVAPHHARLALGEDGRLALQVGDSRNGVALGTLQLDAGAQAAVPAAGALLTVGSQRLRLRLAGAPLADELVLARPLAGGRLLLLMLLVWVATQVGHRWIELDPGATVVQWLPWLLGLPAGLAAWCGAWALASKLFRHGFDFMSHAAIALAGLLAFELMDLVLPLAAAALDLPLLWQVHRQWLRALLGVLVLRQHLLQVLPQRGQALNIVLAALLAAALAVNLAVNHRELGRVFSAPYMTTLPPPALQLRTPVPVDSLDSALDRLRDTGQQRARDAVAEDGPDDGTAR